MDDYREIFLMQQTYATLFSLANKIQVKADKYLGAMTSRQIMTMVAIGHLQEDQTTLNNIARKLGTTKQSVKQVITIMERKGYVVTVPSQQDKRAVNVKITEYGKQACVEVSERSVYFFANVFKDLKTEEIETLWGLLKKLYRFDGEEQDGFEEEGNVGIEVDQEELTRVIKEVGRLRQETNGK
ncbi:MarR family winged helix-turn-helix transcriptional regulator [Clostridium akagii]|uniref:MarR family winged helix-turn-helix transcriptional regulator n=1 Tax=Clostridium akagii TaxID=91623 RepID=UPI00047CBA8C|nr:MarR family transcriptional regulator [Clostridium akagii]